MRATAPGLAAPRSQRANAARISARAPDGDHGGDDLLGCGSLGALSHRIRIALEHDQRGGAGWMCRREQGTRRDRAVHRQEDSLATAEIVEHRGDAVGPLLQRRQARPM